MFISRVELLPEDETTAEHDEAKVIEAQLIETDRTARTNGEPGLFKGAFGKTQLQFRNPIHDEEDGVMRCPMCAWEMEDGECSQCGHAEPGFSDGDSFDTVGSPGGLSTEGSTMEPDDDHPDYDNPDHYPFAEEQPLWMRPNSREWLRAEGARRAARENRGTGHQDRASTAETDISHSDLERRYDDHMSSGIDSEDDEEMPAFVERHPYDDRRWNANTAEAVDEDEEMTSADEESTTSFHRAAILARDRGFNPPFESDISTNGDGETITNASNSSEDSTDSEDDSDTPEPAPTTQRLASRPARIVIDSDDDSSSDSSSEEEDGPPTAAANRGLEEVTGISSSEDDSTPSPPRPAAARQARVQMHRGRRGGRGRGRPRLRN
jgi:hypothetical protein